MNDVHALLMILVMSIVTFLLRAMPFVIFPAGKETPRPVVYLSKALPCAIIGMLVIYCMKGVSLTEGNHGIPELLCVLTAAALHKWRHNALLSIAVSTLLYMLLVQMFF